VDLIVMSTRGQSGLSRWLMGSVSDRVVRGANVPVLMVRAKKKE
jgi:nucleotide-binding universal stress UspA family protein